MLEHEFMSEVNANLLLRRMRTIDARQLAKILLPTSINALLYVSKESPQMCPDPLPPCFSIECFSIEHRSTVTRIDERLTPQNLAYVVFNSEVIVHESWVSFDTLLPSQYGFDSRFPVIAHSSTVPQYRGKSIYPYTLNYILNDLRNRNIISNAYILVSPSNKASIKGIERANFKLVARLKGIRFLGFLIINKSMIRLDNHLTFHCQ
jgi:hypothetical protein